MHSMMGKATGKIIWAITAIGSLHHGMVSLGYDLPTMIGLHDLSKPVGIVFGIAGLLSLIMLISCCCWGEDKSCNK